MSLAQRVEKNIVAKYDGNRVAALKDLQAKCSFYAWKADRYAGSKFHQQWRDVYQAYSSARFAIDYWLLVEDGYWDDA